MNNRLVRTLLTAYLALPALAVVLFGGRAFLDAAPVLLLLPPLSAVLAVVAVRNGLWRMPVDAVAFLPLLLWMGWLTLNADQVVPARRVLIQVMVCWCYYTVLRSTPNRRFHRWTFVCYLLSLVGLAAALIALYDWGQGGRQMLWRERPPQWMGRAGGWYLNPSHLANFLAMVVMLTLGETLRAGRGAMVRTSYGLIALTCTVTIFATYSRGGVLALAAGSLVLLGGLYLMQGRLSARRAIRIGITAAALLLTGWGVLRTLPLWKIRLAQRYDLRTFLWDDTLRMIQNQPWSGHGLGTFASSLRPFMHPYHFLNEVMVRHAHNEPLHLMAEAGIVAGGLAGLGLAVWWGAWCWGISRPTDPEEGRRALVVASVAVVALVQAQVDLTLHLLGNVLCVLLLAGTGLPSKPRSSRSGSPRGATLAGAATVVIFSGWALWHGWHAIQSERAIQRGMEQAVASDLSAALEQYQIALAFEPENTEAMIGVGSIHLARGQWLLDAEKRRASLREAEAWYRRAWEANPLDVAAAIGLSQSLRYDGRGEEALAFMQPLQRKIRRDPLLLRELIRVYDDLGDLDRAIQYAHSLVGQWRLKSDRELSRWLELRRRTASPE